MFWRSLYSKFFLDWETILRDFCVDWIIGWVVCWIAFIYVFFSFRKTVLKNWLDTSSTPPWYLAICRASQAFFVTQSQHLLDTWWIDRESSCILDSFLDTSAIEDQILNTYLDTSRYLHLSRFTSCLYKASVRSRFHFSSISLSILLCFSPKTISSYFKLVHQGFFKIFQVSPYLVSS